MFENTFPEKVGIKSEDVIYFLNKLESPDRESKVPPMMGWSAGAYMEALYLKEQGKGFL